MKNTIGFPGLGLEFTVNETAFTLFGLKVQWYGIILTIGIILASMLFYRLTVKREKIPEDHILNIALITIPVAIIGARFTYVITNLSDYETIWDALNIRGGGLAIYGSVVFGFFSILLYCKVKKLPFYKIVDIASLSVMVGQIIGRWGNFINAEAFGVSKNIKNLPWRMTIRENGGPVMTVHPTFLYESLWNLLGFLILYRLYKKKKFDGQICLVYVAWYGFGRGLIEFLRTDSLRGIFGEKLFVYFGLGSFVIATTLLIILLRKAKKHEEELKVYQEVYGSVENTKEEPSYTAEQIDTTEETNDGEDTPDEGETHGNNN